MTGRSPRRWPISFRSIAAHDDAPSVNPNWNAETRSNAEPCSSSPEYSSSLISGSRNEIIDASRLLRPSPVVSVKRGELPSATQRMYTPARQSACCSETSVGVPFLFSLAIRWMAWPYSWAITIVTAMSPLASRSAGSSSPRSQPMVSSSGQNAALTRP